KYELQSVTGFDLQTIGSILPFVKVNRDFETLNITPKEVFSNGKHELLIRTQVILEDQKGFLPIDSADLAESPNSRYLGSKPKLYARYRFKYRNNISFGVTAEKDAGEEFFQGTQKKGFDFYSAHAFAKNIGPIKRLAIGDYQVQFGQGLTVWTGLSLGKSPDVMNIKKSAQSIKPYTSVNENLFMRGGALTVGFKDFEFTAFYSKKKIDANVVRDTFDFFIVQVTSFVQSGFHSKPSELENKDAIDETILGGNLSYKKRNFSMGFTAMRSETEAYFDRVISPYNQFEFTGDNNVNIGLDYNYIYKNVNLFGEVSRSLNGGMGYINGALVGLDPRLSITLLHRHFDMDFQNLFSNAISEGSRNINEDGLYFGAISKLNRKWTLSGYYDTFVFKWLRYRTDAPSHGSEWRTELKYKHSKRVEIYARGRREIKRENPSPHRERIDNLVSVSRTYMRINAKYKVTDNLKFQSRIERSEYVKDDGAPDKGYILFQDIIYKMPNAPVTVSFRYAVIETDSYNSRIYAYENDVLYAFSIPAYYYRGSRMYLMGRLKLRNGMSLWLRFAQTYYDDRDVFSGGSLNEIRGKTKSEVKAMLKYKF
ncbi:MAG: hypothetical protein JKX73_06730, partial [Flavobacteriales bacterium]|nr:hypothetical protein [Flavobacteriales bacterium]